jgi:hypothetical protein
MVRVSIIDLSPHLLILFAEVEYLLNYGGLYLPQIHFESVNMSNFYRRIVANVRHV